MVGPMCSGWNVFLRFQSDGDAKMCLLHQATAFSSAGDAGKSVEILIGDRFHVPNHEYRVISMEDATLIEDMYAILEA